MKKALLVLVLIIAAVAFVAWKTGYLGKLAGTARVKVLPADAGLLAFYDVKAPGAAVVQLPLATMPESDKLADKMKRAAADIEETTGIRLAVDVDAVAFDDKMQVARGRFSWSRMSPKLEAAGYVVTNDEGAPIAIKSSSGDAVAVAGNYALHGPADVVTAALARQRDGTGIPKDGAVAAIFKEIGWGHAIVGGAALADRPDLGQVLQGNVQPRAVGLAADRTERSTELTVLVIAGTAGQAEDMAKQVRDARQAALDSLKGATDPLSIEARSTLVQTTITVDADHLTVWAPVSDALVKMVVDESPAQRAQQTMRAPWANAALGAFLRSVAR